MKVCPYLGKVDDQETPILYPSEVNGCSQGMKLFVPVLQHQQDYCLSRYQDCPAFSDKQQANSIRSMELPRVEMHGNRKAQSILILAVVGLGIFLIYWISIRNAMTTSQEGNQTLPTSAYSIAAANTVLPENGKSFSPVPTITDPPVIRSTDTLAAPTRVPIVGLETPIGTDVKLLIHRLKTGENFDLLERQYNTTTEAIKWVNFELPVPLWENWLIVIPVNSSFIDPVLPAFQAYEVTGGDAEVEGLVRELEVQEDLFLLYNDLYQGQVLPDGSWVLIPHTRER